MADDLSKTGKADDQRINIEQDHEVNYWTQKLAGSSMVKDTQRHLGR